MDREIIRKSFLSTCGIGRVAPELQEKLRSGGVPAELLRQKDSGFIYAATGFVVAPRLIMTAWHVVAEYLKKGMHITQLFAAFSTFPANAPAQSTYYGITDYYNCDLKLNSGEIVPSGHPRNDFVILRTQEELPNTYPFQFATSANVYIGDPVAVCGFYGGQKFRFGERFAYELRRGPLTFLGHVAGITRERTEVGSEVLDIFVDASGGAGLSGSAVFNGAGEVIGVVASGFDEVFYVDEYKGEDTRIESSRDTDAGHGESAGQQRRKVRIPLGVLRVLPTNRTSFEGIVSTVVNIGQRSSSTRGAREA